MSKAFVKFTLAALLALLLVQTVCAVETYQMIAQWGSPGSGDGQFNYPVGIAMDASGNLYVADEKNNRIQKFDSDGGFLAKWGSYGTGDGQFNWPCGVTVDPSGNVYVSDYGNSRIQKFDSNGGFLAKWGSYGTGDGQFNYPWGIAMDASGNVYVADYYNNRIQKFDSGGGFLTKWGSYGSGDGQFYDPSGIAVDASDNVYVTEVENHRIQKFDSGGGFLTKWGSFGTGDGQFNHPVQVAVDTSAKIYVADLFNDRIQKFDSNGGFITKWGSFGSGNGQFYYPYGIAVTVDASGNVYVVDGYNHRVQKFGKQQSMMVVVHSPVDIKVTDPDGLVISKTENQITGATYTERDLDGDGSPDGIITVPNPKVGNYQISVTPKAGADPNSKYTLTAELNGVTLTLADNVMIQDITGVPYGIQVKNTGEIVITPTAMVLLKDSLGTGLSGGSVQYYSSGWKDFGITDNEGKVTKELPPGNYNFRMTYGSASVDKQQDVKLNPVVTFQTRGVSVEFRDSTNQLMDTGIVQYYASGWKPFGTTSGGTVSKELLPGNYNFRMTYGSASVDKQQDVKLNQVVTFQTQKVTAELRNSAGQLMDSGTVQYYASGWKPFGTTSGGTVSKELLPMNYNFRMTYGSASVDKQQDVKLNQIVTFQTQKVTAELRNSAGQLMDSGTVQYYASGWKPFGTTAGGTVSKELLAMNYNFRMTYGGASVDKQQDITAIPTVTFQTGKVVSDSGTCTKYYASAWKPFTNGMELLPQTYNFRFNVGTPDTQFSIQSATINHIK
jgi:hypothetical protein